jgi:hypothetical protein
MSERIAAGFDYIFYGVVNSSGYVIGNTATGATSGDATGQSLLRLDGARTIPVSLPPDEVVTVVGDNAPQVSFNFPPAELPSGQLEMSTRNSSFDALIQGTLVEDLADLEISVYGPGDRDQPDMCLLLMRKAKKWEIGVQGVKAWEIAFVPRCTITPLLMDITQREFTPYRYNINLQTSDRKPWGATFTAAVSGTRSGTIIIIDGDNPVMIHTHVGDAVEQNFDLAVTPVSSAKTSPFVNGVTQTTPGDYSLVTAQLQFVAAVADSAVLNTIYELTESDLETVSALG